jgi:hypothetical protein
MAALGKKLRTLAGGEGAPDWRGSGFWCPGCDSIHVIKTSPGGWTFDGNADAPTFSPSILVTGGGARDKDRCHSFVRAGKIEFLSDCSHALAGKTVDMPDWPYAEGEYGGV